MEKNQNFSASVLAAEQVLLTNEKLAPFVEQKFIKKKNLILNNPRFDLYEFKERSLHGNTDSQNKRYLFECNF